MKKATHKKIIVEKQLGISPDYQFKALRNSHFLQSHWHANKFSALEQILNLNKTMNVLDLGAGSGNFELLFHHKVKSITAVDYHDEALLFLESKLKEYNIKNVQTLTGDIREPDLKHKLKKYDLIIMVDVIEHIRKEEAQSLIRLFKEILKPSGTICIVTPNYKSLWIYIEKFLDKFTIVPHFEGQQHLAQYYPKNLIELFTSNDLEAEHIKTFNTVSFLSPVKALSTFLTKLELWSGFRYGNLLLGTFRYEKK